MNSNNSVSLPIKLFAQLPPLKDHPKTVHHKVIYEIYLEYVDNDYRFILVMGKM